MSFFSIQLKKLRLFSSYSIVLLGFLLIAGCESVEDRIQSYYESGLKLVEEGKPVKAGLEFRNALKLNNDYAPALYQLAKVEFKQGEILKAVGFFQKVIEIDSKHLGALNELSRIFLLAGQLEKAQNYADQAFAINATDTNILVSKAAIALKRKKTSDAIRFADAALKAEPQNVEALIVRAAERMGAGDPKGALAFLNKGPEASKGKISLQLFKLKVFEALKDDEGVERVFIKLISLDSESSQMPYGLARWYLRKGRKDDAEKLIRKFAKDNPENVKAGLNLVRFISTQRGKAAAKKELVTLIKENSSKAFDYRLALAEATFAENKTQEAIDLMNKLIADEDGTEEGSKARLYLAQKLLRLNKKDKAEALIDTILKNDAEHTAALTIRGALQIEKGKPAAAVETLLVALNQEPRSTRVLQLLGLAYERDGKAELAEEQLVKAASIEEFKPKSGLNLVQFLLRYGKTDNAENVLARIVERDPSNAQAQAQLARAKLRKKDWSGADAIADNLQKADPKNKAVADQIRGAALAGQNKYDESIRSLQASRSSNPDQSVPTANLFRVYLRAGKYDEAENLIRSTLEKNPNDVQAYVRLGLLYTLKNNLVKAEATYKTSIEKNPNSMVGYYSLADFYLKTNRPKEAEQTTKDGLQRQQNNGALRLLLATIYERTGQIDAAIKEYEALYKIEPRSTIVANNLASLLSDRRAGTSDLDRAYEIAFGRFRNSRVPQFLDTLGWIHNLRGEYGEAVGRLRTAANGLPDIGLVQFHLGMAYKGLGRNELAIASLQKANDLMKNSKSPQRDEVRKVLDQLISASGKEQTKNKTQ